MSKKDSETIKQARNASEVQKYDSREAYVWESKLSTTKEQNK